MKRIRMKRICLTENEFNANSHATFSRNLLRKATTMIQLRNRLTKQGKRTVLLLTKNLQEREYNLFISITYNQALPIINQ